MPKYLISYRKTEGGGQKPEWTSFTAQHETALESHAIRERVDRRMSVLGEQLWAAARSRGPAAAASTTCSTAARKRRRRRRSCTAWWRSSRRRRGSAMPKRTDLKRILIIGSGPIVIGQACEFDYSGTQGCRALREEGFEVVLVNSNPATIMTDPEMAHRTYVEPLTPEFVAKIIERERPDALLPTLGGQTALNLAVALAEDGTLDRFGVELIGAKIPAIKKAEDRELFKQAIERIGLTLPRSGYARTFEEAKNIVRTTGYPAIIRPSFTLGGTGGSIAYNPDELDEAVRWGLQMSPLGTVLIEESVIGWKEFELEVMRDLADNVVIICSIENVDPMGVHTGDSVTVAPAQTLTDKEYQLMRDAAVK